MNILPTACSLLLTEQCNLRCKYCFEKHKDNWMNKETVIKSIDWLFDNAIVNNNNDIVSVTMFGGEPMLNWKIMEIAFERCLQKKQETGIDCNCSIITNATIMSDEIYNMLKKYRDKVKLTVQLSIDGIEEVQNMYRVYVNGNSTWEKVKRNIPMWKKIFSDCLNRLSVHGCINHKTVKYLYENYKYFYDTWDIKKIWYIPVAEEKWTDEDVTTYKQQMSKIYNHIINIVKNDVKKINTINKKFNKILKQYNYENINDAFINNNYDLALNKVYNYSPLDKCFNCGQPMSNKTCGAGINYVTITTQGEIYPCHQIYFNDDDKSTLIGNIFIGIDEMKRKIFLEYDAKEDFLGCEGCNHNNCYRCLASNYVNKGNMFSQIKDKYCKMMKIDKYYQEKLKGDLISMGLLNGKQHDCNRRNCNQHITDIVKGCDLVKSCNDNYNDDIIEAFDTLAMGIGEIYKKVDNIENQLKKK